MTDIRTLTPAEIAAWERQQDPADLPVIDLKKLSAIKRYHATQRRLAAAEATRAEHRAIRKRLAQEAAKGDAT